MFSSKCIVLKNTMAENVRISHGPFVGLPSISGLTGLNRAFCVQLANGLHLSAAELQPHGIVLAVENYTPHYEFKTRFKPIKPSASPQREAIPAQYASFTAHFIMRVRPTTERAQELLSAVDLRAASTAIINRLRLCGGNLHSGRVLTTLRRADRESEELTALRELPSFSLVLRDRADIVAAARENGLGMMETLIASALPHINRPTRYKEFFESQGTEYASLAPVANGFLVLEDRVVARGTRMDATGAVPDAYPASATYTIAQLQKAAVLRAALNSEAPEDPMVFWKEFHSDNAFLSHHIAL